VSESSAGVVRVIGMTQDVYERRRTILCGSPLVPFLNFGLPSTKSGKTNGVLVEGDFATLVTSSFLDVCEISTITKKIFF
jgi:hypothetical protein